MRRHDLLPLLGIEPAFATRIRAILADRIRAAEALGPPAVLDAGCGHKSPLVPFRSRIGRLVGLDLHAPDSPLPWLDDFTIVDLCRPGADASSERFDLVLSNFTLEHFAAPQVALANLRSCLRPGGWLVVTTVNRRHPFVDAYMRLPNPVRGRLQPMLKPTAADAHPLVGGCNTPRAVRVAIEQAGFEDFAIETVPNLARAWGRHRATFAVGLVGDLLAQSMPRRRSTIIAVARAPDPDGVGADLPAPVTLPPT